MELKKPKVIMLPTEDKTAPILRYKGSINNKISLQYFTNTYWSNNDLTKQHLYFTTDDEIKEGDWYLLIDPAIDGSHNRYSVYQATKGRLNNMKIMKSCTFKKIIVTTDKSLGLPQPSQAFIEKYCKLGGIDEVMVEYEIIHADRAPNGFEKILKTNSHNKITIHSIKNSWNREEVIELLYKSLDANVTSNEKLRKVFILQLNKWIEENL